VDGAVEGLGFGVTRAPAGAVVTLVVILASAALFTIGWRLAVQRRYQAHHRVQIAAVCLNAAVVLAWMIRSLVLFVIPAIPAKLGQGSYAVATAHAVIGIIGVTLGVWVVLVASELVPKAVRFTDFKTFMRGSYAMYMLATLSGVTLYVVAYVRLP
jgi:uncharacterized membrane protein YozB (DUF420 family)